LTQHTQTHTHTHTDGPNRLHRPTLACSYTYIHYLLTHLLTYLLNYLLTWNRHTTMVLGSRNATSIPLSKKRAINLLYKTHNFTLKVLFTQDNNAQTHKTDTSIWRNTRWLETHGFSWRCTTSGQLNSTPSFTSRNISGSWDMDGDLTIFFTMAAVSHLGFVGPLLPPTMTTWCGLYRCAEFG